MMLRRTSTFAVTKLLIVLISYLPALHSRPTNGFHSFTHYDDDDGGFPAEDPTSPVFWWKLGISLILVLLGGVFAGTSPTIMSFLFRIDVGIVESG